MGQSGRRFFVGPQFPKGALKALARGGWTEVKSPTCFLLGFAKQEDTLQQARVTGGKIGQVIVDGGSVESAPPRLQRRFGLDNWIIDVASVRARLGLTQDQFAARFGFSVATLRHWERGDRRPQGAALVLLNLIDREPQAVMRALR